MILAICIPTHHGRGPLLRAAVDSVVDQLTGDLPDKVQISISDNAPRDGTAEMGTGHQERLGADRVRYRRNEQDLGYLPTFLAVVEQADADFCGLLGSDDTIAPFDPPDELPDDPEHEHVAAPPRTPSASAGWRWTTYRALQARAQLRLDRGGPAVRLRPALLVAPEFWLRTFPVLLVPHPALPVLKRLSEIIDRVTGRPVRNRL